MRFSGKPSVVTVETRDGVTVEIVWEDWGGDRRGTTWTKWMTDPAASWPDRFRIEDR